MENWYKMATGKVICPQCGDDLSEDGEFPAMLGNKKTLMCAGCGERVTELGELVSKSTPVVKVRKKAPTFNLADLATPGTAEKWLSQSNFDVLF